MKPRIKKCGRYWKCEDYRLFRIGPTPADAYRNWIGGVVVLNRYIHKQILGVLAL